MYELLFAVITSQNRALVIFLSHNISSKIEKFKLSFIDKFEPDAEIDGAYYKAIDSIKLLNDQIKKARNKCKVVVARNLTEFNKEY